MKYKVHYIIYCSTEVEANTPTAAEDSFNPLICDMDDWEVTDIYDEDGKLIVAY